MSLSRTVKEPAPLLEFLFAEWAEVKKSKVKDWLKTKSVHVNGRPTSQFNHMLAAGDVVSIGTAKNTSAPTGGIKIVFEDDAIIVIEKPEGLLSMASESERDTTAYALLNEYLRAGMSKAKSRVLIVHRLDRETSGLMLFAKTREAQQTLEANWAKNEKHYFAVVEGSPKANEGVLHSHLDESQVAKVVATAPSPRTREAKTHYRVLKRGLKHSLVELRLETGRRHQIRVQMSDIGCPCIGDAKYGAKTNPAKRLGLHSCLLCFNHPISDKNMRFQSPLPPELARIV